MKINSKINSIFLIVILFTLTSYSQRLEDNIWKQETSKTYQEEEIIFYKKTPKYSSFLQLDINNLLNRLSNVPKREFSNKNEGEIIYFPNESGELYRFLIQEASVFEPELQAKFPDIRSFVGKGIDDPTAIIRFSVSPQKGFSAMILNAGKTVFIEPYTSDLKSYISFVNSSEDGPRAKFLCETRYEAPKFKLSDEEFLQMRNANDGVLRTYRLALACTVEYAQFHGGTIPSVLAAMNTSMTRVNGIFERDLSLTMVIVANNQNVIFLGPDVDSDPYDNGNGSAMLNQNQTTCNANIGSANYDIGHVFSTGGGGIAQLRSPCTNGKARGVTGQNSPIGDTFDVDYVAHEMGHQFGGNHTQNNNCQRSGVSVEPGSASTIMGYAGICNPNVQNNSDDYFHGENIKEMWANISTGNSSTCFNSSFTNNNAPNASAGNDFSIPKSTAFVLRGSATDSDTSSGITYCWEQTDTTPAQMPPVSTNSAGPMFRSLDPSSSPNRYMPPLNTVMNGSLATTWEVIPSVSRTMNFSLTVRDNELGGAATDSDEMVVTVLDVTPFSVNTPPTWSPNTNQVVTWVVGETDIAPINSQTVNILFTTNNGISFTTLASGVPNNGSANITVPNVVNTNNAKILVEASDNIFYAVSNAFSIGTTPDFSFSNSTGNLSVCGLNDSATLTFDFITTNGFSENTTFNVTGLPSGLVGNFTPSSANSSNTISLELTGITNLANNDYNITATATSASITKNETFTLTVSDSECPQECEIAATSNNLNISVPDGVAANTAGPTLTNTITIPSVDNVIISDINVNVNISHTYIDDLEITLQHVNSSTSVTLWDRDCGNENNINVTFDDDGTSINCSITNTGVYSLSNGTLSDFNGLNSEGEWILSITDFWNGDQGILNDWSVEICSVALSLEDNSFDELLVYPNPNNGDFTVAFSPKFNEAIKIDIYDIRGRMIYNNDFNYSDRFNKTIKMDNAQSGVYLLSIINGPNRVTKKIVIN